MKTEKSQTEQIRDFLATGARITAIQALKFFGCLRLSGRIYELREQGFNIKSEMVKLKNGKHVKQYWL